MDFMRTAMDVMDNIINVCENEANVDATNDIDMEVPDVSNNLEISGENYNNSYNPRYQEQNDDVSSGNSTEDDENMDTHSNGSSILAPPYSPHNGDPSALYEANEHNYSINRLPVSDSNPNPAQNSSMNSASISTPNTSSETTLEPIALPGTSKKFIQSKQRTVVSNTITSGNKPTQIIAKKTPKSGYTTQNSSGKGKGKKIIPTPDPIDKPLYILDQVTANNDGFKTGFEFFTGHPRDKLIVKNVPELDSCQECIDKEPLDDGEYDLSKQIKDGSYKHQSRIIARVLHFDTQEFSGFYMIKWRNHPNLYELYNSVDIAEETKLEYAARLNGEVHPGAVGGVSFFKKGPTIHQEYGLFNNKYNAIYAYYLSKQWISDKNFEFFGDQNQNITKQDMCYWYWKRIRLSWNELLGNTNFYIVSSIAGSNARNKVLLRQNKLTHQSLKGYYLTSDKELRVPINRIVKIGKEVLLIFMTMAYNEESSNFCHCSVLVIKEDSPEPKAYWYDPINVKDATKTPPPKVLELLGVLRVHKNLTILNGEQFLGNTDCLIRAILFIANYCDGRGIYGYPQRYFDIKKNRLVESFN